MADANMEDVEQQFEDISDPGVAQKYKEAAAIVNQVLAEVLKNIAPGKKALELCELGDKLIKEKVAPYYKSQKKMEKGIAFPTCVNVDNIVCHFSPSSPAEDVEIKPNSVVRVDLGVHIDGYIAVAAHTVVVSGEQITGRAADALAAAKTAADAAMRLLVPGTTNTKVTEAINRAAAAFNCTACEGVLSHQLKRFVIDGAQVIINKPTVDQKVEEFTFKEYEVYGIDIVISTGEGRLKEKDQKPLIYKRAPEYSYNLKMQSSRDVMKEISKFASMPFSVRYLTDKRARMGLLECWRHNLIDPYPVLYSKPGEIVAQLKFTVLITPHGPQKITGLEVQSLKSEFSVQDEQLKALLARPIMTKKSKGKKTEAAAAAPAPMDMS
eukprot:GEZU01035987.1.p1 GENE.GEZU01035987.1~~GEZU01035987.1.p1  ORF type:complete len:392 (-),score=164.78 GEZU01035987.1:242-1384(-)